MNAVVILVLLILVVYFFVDMSGVEKYKKNTIEKEGTDEIESTKSHIKSIKAKMEVSKNVTEILDMIEKYLNKKIIDYVNGNGNYVSIIIMDRNSIKIGDYEINLVKLGFKNLSKEEECALFEVISESFIDYEFVNKDSYNHNPRFERLCLTLKKETEEKYKQARQGKLKSLY